VQVGQALWGAQFKKALVHRADQDVVLLRGEWHEPVQVGLQLQGASLAREGKIAEPQVLEGESGTPPGGVDCSPGLVAIA